MTRSRHRLCIAAIETTLACCGVSERSGSLSGPCLGPLFDHLVGAREHNRRNCKAERIRAALVPDPVFPASVKNAPIQILKRTGNAAACGLVRLACSLAGGVC